MANKKRADSFFQKKVSNRLAYTIISAFLLILVGIFVYAQTPNPGHSINQIGRPESCSSGQVLIWGGTGWACTDTSSGIRTQWTQSGSSIYYNQGSVGIGTSTPLARFHVVGGLRLDDVTLTNPTVTASNKYLTINLDGTPYLIPLYVTTTGLIGGVHTAAQCTSAGGTVVSVTGGSICRFNNAQCPSGWAQYQAWSTTTSNTCSNSDPICHTECATGSHAWNNVASETCQYYDEIWTGTTCYRPEYPETCTATRTQIGCY